MRTPALTHEGEKILQAILMTRAAIARDGWRARINRVLELVMKERGAEEADQGLVIEAAEMVLGRSHSPVMPKLKDPKDYRQRFLSRYLDLASYYAGPYEVKRWNRIAVSQDKLPQEMKVVAFSASPRKNGNTEALTDEALRGAHEAGASVEKFRIQEMNIGYCIGCRRCKEVDFTKICAIEDDMNIVYNKMLEADAILITFPVYQWREPAQLAVLMDRLDAFHRAKPKATSTEALLSEKRSQRFQDVLTMYSTLIDSPKRAMMITTWGYPYIDAYEDTMERVMNTLSQFNIEVVEAISACGFIGLLRGLDEKRNAIIIRFPHEMAKAYQAGRSLVTGEG